jgi:hypothetical protein
VGNPAPIPSGCGASATGDFGMLESPRAGVSQLADATALNIAEGMDHVLATWADRSGGASLPSNTQMDSCRGAAQTPVPGAYLDVPGAVEPDCVEIKTGMNTDTVTDGLIQGGTANGVPYEGRLKTDTLDGCDRRGGSDESTRIGVSGLNDDVLSCFLPNGVSVGDVIGSSVPAAASKKIDPRIFKSPRYSIVPVIHYEFNPQNGFYPIVRWQPIFISDESPASTKGASYATSLNGVITGSNKVVGVQVLVINPAALPDTAPSEGAGWVPYLGSGPKLVRLVD